MDSAAISRQVVEIMTVDTPAPPLRWISVLRIHPILGMGDILWKGLPPTFAHMWHYPRDMLHWRAWKQVFYDNTQPWILADLDDSCYGMKEYLLSKTKGTVLEIGAGTGESIKYYPAEKIDRIYGVEPDTHKCKLIEEEAKELEMSEKYKVVPCGIEKTSKLEEFGITPESIDTIVCV